jgi:S-adenosyl-L-methionine hydrolase (adenosine-forming)
LQTLQVAGTAGGKLSRMIVLFTDFGLQGPYMGQMKAVLHQKAPGTVIVDLFADAPIGNAKASAYLLAAYSLWFPPGTVFLSVVDPGVGGTRPALIVKADNRWYVGPGNGLFELVQRRSEDALSWDIDWKPEHLSASFHGRDLFAPIAAMLARGDLPPGRSRADAADRRPDWPDDLAEIIYIDHFGNAMTGLRAATLTSTTRLAVGDRVFERARTFSDLPPGTGFWYENSNGLAEIAVNQGRANLDLGLTLATRIQLVP